MRITFDLEYEVDDAELILHMADALEAMDYSVTVRKFTYRDETYDLTE
jgi:hypothetical protein